MEVSRLDFRLFLRVWIRCLILPVNQMDIFIYLGHIPWQRQLWIHGRRVAQQRRNPMLGKCPSLRSVFYRSQVQTDILNRNLQVYFKGKTGILHRYLRVFTGVFQRCLKVYFTGITGIYRYTSQIFIGILHRYSSYIHRFTS